MDKNNAIRKCFNISDDDVSLCFNLEDALYPLKECTYRIEHRQVLTHFLS